MTQRVTSGRIALRRGGARLTEIMTRGTSVKASQGEVKSFRGAALMMGLVQSTCPKSVLRTSGRPNQNKSPDTRACFPILLIQEGGQQCPSGHR